MKRRFKLIWLSIGVLVLVVVALWVFGPYEEVDLSTDFSPTAMSKDPDSYFKIVESQFKDITPGVEKRVIWAGEARAKTDWVVLYVHGFSATSEEIRPVPDKVAAALGANLVYTRLTGHGRTGDAMAEATAHDWMNDLAEGLTAARIAGKKVLILSTSTGGTITAAGAQDPDLFQGVEGVVFVSPNFGINSGRAPLLTWPAARTWLPLIAGSERELETRIPEHGIYWTAKYPTVAVLPMAALVKTVTAMDHSTTTIPALFWFSDDDQVVDAAATRKITKTWGGPVTLVNPKLGPDDDPSAHVVAGDLMSPGQTDIAVTGILDWIKGL